MSSFPDQEKKTVPFDRIPHTSITIVEEHTTTHQERNSDCLVLEENSIMHQCISRRPILSAEDPELENYYEAVKKPTVLRPDVPLVTWVLVSLFLMSAIQKNATESLIGEMSQLFAAAQPAIFQKSYYA